jgi:cytochrome c peroxidase
MPFTSPRAVVYRAATQTLLVASEGTDHLVELDAQAIAPSLTTLRSYAIGQRYEETLAGPREGSLRIAAVGAAPSGIALSEDESIAYVFCRATYDLAIVTLDGYKDAASDAKNRGPVPFVDVADDPLSDEIAIGRRLFYNATDSVMSGGMACAGCHPEGRDDAFVWHEEQSPFDEQLIFVSNPFMFSDSFTPGEGDRSGMARQTPMLAGRVDRAGPYSWHGESATLVDRIAENFRMHRWFAGWPQVDEETLRIRARHLASFLREGLVAPPSQVRELAGDELRGREIFLSETTQCAQCHLPEKAYSHDETFPLSALAVRPGFRADPDSDFKVPSLRFVGGTAPYLHDGSAATLEDLLARDHDRMGRTSSLSPRDRLALVAFLKML